MTPAVLDHAPDLDAGGFAANVSAFKHRLHTQMDWSDAALAGILDRYPREHLGVFTMGEDACDRSSWRRGDITHLPGERLIEIAKTGRVWFNLRATNVWLPDYANLADRMFGELESTIPGLKTFKRDIGLLIASPRAQVFYHLDVARVALWHLRGHKRVWLYPPEAPYVSPEALEAIVLRETAEQLDYRREFDAGAECFDLSPGDMVSWPQNAPHRIVNEDDLNVSISAEFLTPAALVRANAIYTNGVLRRRFGLSPGLGGSLSPVTLMRAGLARLLKLSGGNRRDPLAPSFRIDPAEPGGLAAL
ncbi:hypothetical protein HXX25_12390 [Hyphobacterium sp. CCMP332]|uniref:hypothetical protein n=1 Tax=Hyphobacterium sp. CCMP332 TaxID=2749086 RepID=UPI0016508A4B|nr:hypothetical protein [Hyphobacterium sp. CCMP332]QNL20056.1 hypothetical protein HXX25_12390 [Hyphobacterium sp. CCMP332]